MTQTNFQPGSVLYSANLNTAFANTVNIAGDTMTGTLILPTFQTTGGASFANGGLNITNGGINTTQLNVSNMNVFSTVTAAFTEANLAASIAQAAFNRANTGGAAGGVQTILTNNGLTINTGTFLAVTGNNTVVFAANNASVTQVGVVQLNDTVVSTSASLAATANAVNTAWSTAKAAFNKANSGVTNITQTYLTSNGITVNTGTSLTTTGNGTVLFSANNGNTTQPGIVQLEDTGSVASLSLATSANIANMVWTTAKAAFNKANAGGGAISQNFITTNGLSVNGGSFLNTSGNNSLIFTGNNASVTQVGVVQLNDTVSSTSTSQAATANALSATFNTAQGAFNAANAGFSGLQTTYLGGQGITINNSVLFTVTGSGSVAFAANSGTTSSPGILQLNDTVTSQLSNQAATANAVNTAFTTARAAYAQANLSGPGITTTFITNNGISVNGGSFLAATGNTTLILTANSASTTTKGIIQMNDTVTSNSFSQAATANAVNTVWATASAAFKAANNFSGGITTTYFATNGVSINGGSSLIVIGSGNPSFAGVNASTTFSGVVQLNDTVSSVSTTQAATANSVNTTFKIANNAVMRAGDTMTGTLNIPTANIQTLIVTGNTSLSNSTFSSNGTITLGNQANTKGMLGRMVFSGGSTSNVGDTQVATNILYRKATSNGSFTLTLDGQAPRTTPYGSINLLLLSDNSVFVFKGYVAGRDTISNNTKVWSVEGAMKRGIGPSSTVWVTGSPIINIIADDDPLTAGWIMNLTTDTTNGGFSIVTANCANVTNWTSKIDTIELG